MFTIEDCSDYKRALLRITQLTEAKIVDAPEAAELVALLAAVDEWEASCEPFSLEKAKPAPPHPE